MFTLNAAPGRLCDGIDRRAFLTVGGLGALGLAVPTSWGSPPGRHRPRAASFGRARRCVLLFLTGGPPQHDTWDPKPQAPAEIRGAAVWAKQAVAFGHLARLVRPALVNGTVGLVMAAGGRLSRALTFKIANGKITEIEVIGDRARLGELDVSIVEFDS